MGLTNENSNTRNEEIDGNFKYLDEEVTDFESEQVNVELNTNLKEALI
jgi:hypothetical protein